MAKAKDNNNTVLMVVTDKNNSAEKMNGLVKDMLILDDFGIQPFDVQARMNLLDVVEDRSGKKTQSSHNRRKDDSRCGLRQNRPPSTKG